MPVSRTVTKPTPVEKERNARRRRKEVTRTRRGQGGGRMEKRSMWRTGSRAKSASLDNVGKRERTNQHLYPYNARLPLSSRPPASPVLFLLFPHGVRMYIPSYIYLSTGVRLYVGRLLMASRCRTVSYDTSSSGAAFTATSTPLEVIHQRSERFRTRVYARAAAEGERSRRGSLFVFRETRYLGLNACAIRVERPRGAKYEMRK